MTEINFRDIFTYQSRFMQREFERLGVDPDKDLTSIHHSMCSHLQSEVNELLDTEPWHFHKRTQRATPYARCEEMVDIFKWLMNLMYTHGISADRFIDQFWEKSDIVEDRIRTEVFINHIRETKEPVAVFDLDGVLCNRDDTLDAFIRKSLNVVAFRKDSLSAKVYEELKFEFYEQGAFQACEPFTCVLAEVQKVDPTIPIVIATSRDNKRHPRLHFVTKNWLHKHKIRYNALLFAADKDKALCHWVPTQSVFFDDEMVHVSAMNRVCTSIQVSGDDSARRVGDLLNTLAERRKRHAEINHC